MFGTKKSYLLPLEKSEMLGDQNLIKEIKMLRDELKKKDLQMIKMKEHHRSE